MMLRLVDASAASFADLRLVMPLCGVLQVVVTSLQRSRRMIQIEKSMMQRLQELRAGAAAEVCASSFLASVRAILKLSPKYCLQVSNNVVLN